MSREHLAGLLWSDRGEAQARSSLRQALVSLRKDFQEAEPGFLSVKDTRVAIDPTRALIDVVAFQRLSASADIGALRDAAALYRGEFLADTYIRDPVFDEWLTSERRRLADVLASVLEKLCVEENGPARIDFAKRLVALDPLREGSHRTLMQVYAAAGEKGLALRQYQVCRELLRDELRVAPSEATEALYRRLQQTSVDLPAEPVNIRSNGNANVGDLSTLPADKPLVAVLPFDKLGGGPEIEEFCEGLTDDVIAGLSRISSIHVAAHSAEFAGKRRATDPGHIARDRGVRYIVEGSVRRSTGATRVAAQLIDATSGRQLWAQRIDRGDAEPLFDLQDDITRSIVSSVQTQIILNEGRLHTGAGDADRVPRLLARSWQRFLGLTEGSLADCRALAEKALALDGSSGLAHRMRAVALHHQVYMGFIPWTRDAIDTIFTHAKIAIESDDADEYSHWAMECAHLLRKEHDLAAASLRRALEINPNCSLAYGSMGTVLAWSGQHDASVASNELALRANPQDPSNFFRHFGLSLAHYLAGRYDKAVAHARMVVQARPSWALAQLVYAASLGQSQRPDEAARTLHDLQTSGLGISPSLTVLPFARSQDHEHFEAGLRKSGRPA